MIELKFKIVPKAFPNAHGEWRMKTVEGDEEKEFVRLLGEGKWPEYEAAFSPFIPEGFFLVKVSIAETQLVNADPRCLGLSGLFCPPGEMIHVTRCKCRGVAAWGEGQ